MDPKEQPATLKEFIETLRDFNPEAGVVFVAMKTESTALYFALSRITKGVQVHHDNREMTVGTVVIFLDPVREIKVS